MDKETWVLFAVTEAALCISPGPAVLFVTSNALASGFRAAVAASLGIVTGNVVYFAASALGIGALILASGDLFGAIRWAGVAYLVWLGVRMWLGHTTFRPGEQSKAAGRRVWRDGAIVQLSNPKNLVFFIAILPPFIDVAGNVPLQVLILAVTSQCIEILVLLAYGSIGSAAGRTFSAARFAGAVDRISGTLLISVGFALALA